MTQPLKEDEERLSRLDDSTRAFLRRKIWTSVILFLALVTAVGFSGHFLREEMTALANGVNHHLGFAGLAAVLFISETVVSPFPPDLILWVVATSDLSRDWPFLVGILATLSTLGGHLGWLLGSHVGGTRAARLVLGRYRRRSVRIMRRFGLWAIVLAALTPVPWSVTSWTAGILRMPWRLFLLGSLVRFPRIVIYYIVIHATFHGFADIQIP